MKSQNTSEAKIPLLVSKREAAALLGICVRTLDHLIAAKELPARRVLKRVLIPYASLQAFARRDHPSPQPAAIGEVDRQ